MGSPQEDDSTSQINNALTVWLQFVFICHVLAQRDKRLEPFDSVAGYINKENLKTHLLANDAA
jgi:hypothetical protein